MAVLNKMACPFALRPEQLIKLPDGKTLPARCGTLCSPSDANLIGDAVHGPLGNLVGFEFTIPCGVSQEALEVAGIRFVAVRSLPILMRSTSSFQSSITCCTPPLGDPDRSCMTAQQRLWLAGLLPAAGQLRVAVTQAQHGPFRLRG